jgi:23S rRNA pseudouridine1911/1915/1917 synthase
VKVEVPRALDGERADRVVAFLAGIPRSDAAAVVDAGGVRLGGRVVAKGSQRVVAGAELEVDLPPAPGGPAAGADVEFEVVWSDDAVVVVDKPPGLVVHPGAGHATGTLVNGLVARFPDMAAEPWPDPSRPGIVHRLDKGTSGLLMVARTAAAVAPLSAQLKARTVDRRYLALVWGDVADARGVIDAPLARSSSDPTRMTVRADGRPAVTSYEVVERAGTATLLRCTLGTGRTHQVRVHLAAIGHPIVGDDRYTAGARRPAGARAAPVARVLPPGRPFLHAEVLNFDHPVTGERLRFTAPLPPDLVRALASL